MHEKSLHARLKAAFLNGIGCAGFLVIAVLLSFNHWDSKIYLWE